MEAFHAESLARMMKNEKHFDGDSEDEEEKKREMEAMVMAFEQKVGGSHKKEASRMPRCSCRDTKFVARITNVESF